MATARERYFPVEPEDTPGVKLLPPSDSTRPSSAGYENPATSRSRSRSRLRHSSSCGSSSLDSFDGPRKPRKFLSFGVFSIVVIGVAIMFLLGVCLGFYVRELQLDHPDFEEICGTAEEEEEARVEQNDRIGGIYESLMYFIRPRGIREFVEDYGEHDAFTGDGLDNRLADGILRDFRSSIEDTGLGFVREEVYHVTVTSADPARPNELELLHHNGSLLQRFDLRNGPNISGDAKASPPTEDEEPDQGTRPYGDGWRFPHIVQSPAGEAEGPLVYGHYGRRSDFVVLRSLGVKLRDAIVLLRMGGSSVADQIRRSEKEGAKGVLLFWDSSDITFDVADKGDNSSSFVPYASAMDDSIDAATTWLPSIPCQTISADQAQELLAVAFNLSSTTGLVLAPEQWRDSAQTPFGVGVKGRRKTSENHLVRLTVNNIARRRRIRNIIATIEGIGEPDHYAVVGASRASLPGERQDAVVSSSILVQLARAFGHIFRRHKWLPRRGIKFVSWGGAELGDQGIVEMIKKQPNLLSFRMLAYFDLGHLVAGNATVQASIPASLEQILTESTTFVPDPRDAEKMFYRAWKKRIVYGKNNGADPTLNPFLQLLGIPVIHLQYTEAPGSASLVSRAFRQEQRHHFKFHLALIRVITMTVLHVIDLEILPFHPAAAAKSLHAAVWQSSHALDECSSGAVDLGSILAECKKLTEKAKTFPELIKHQLTEKNLVMIRPLNEIAVLFDRLLLVRNEDGHTRHLLHPILPDGSLAAVSELCQVGSITKNWSASLSLEGTLRRVISEATLSLTMGA